MNPNLDPTITRCLGRHHDLVFCDRQYRCARQVQIKFDRFLEGDLPKVSQHCCNAQSNAFIEVGK